MRSQRGFSLVETVMALGVLTVGLLGAAGVLAQGMQKLASSPGDVVTTQKAAEAIETVFAARDSHTLTWAQIRNVHGSGGSDNGIFLDGPQPLKVPGPDGVVNTADDGAVERVVYPGPDQMLGTADDTTQVLDKYTREIIIRDVPNESGTLRSITVTVTYQAGPVQKTYTLTTYISNFS
jgi:prepilin-type N-terminal cleavage/methylation domain-containing protein